MRTLRMSLAVFVAIAALAAVWLNRSRARHSLRDFDAHEVARLENDMWRAYYDHRSFHLFTDLVQLLREQYHLPFLAACRGGYLAARAAVVFQRGHNRLEYTLALPYLVRYYSLIHDASTEDFPVRTVAADELEWWIVHRQRDRYSYADLAYTLAVEQAALFRQPAADFAAHAQARAEAMRLCDNRTSDGDWPRIGAVLDTSWAALHSAVSR